MSELLDRPIWQAKDAINAIATTAARFGSYDRTQMGVILDKVNEANAAMSALLSPGGAKT